MQKLKKRRSFTIDLVAVLLICSLFSVGIGYALITSNVDLDGNVDVQNNKYSIIFQNVQITSGSMNAKTAPTVDTQNPGNLTFALELTQPGQFYEFTFEVKNAGTIDAFLSNLTELTAAQKKYMTVKLTDDKGAAVALNSKLVAGASAKFKVRVDFLQNITVADLPTTTETTQFNIEFTYQQDKHDRYADDVPL